MESKLFRLKRIKTLIWRFFPILFLLLCLVLIVLTVTGNRFIERTKQGSVSLVAPLVAIVSKPVYWVKDGIEAFEDWVEVYHENERLREENEYLSKWRLLAMKLSEEQQELKKYLNYAAPPETHHLMAEVVMDEGSAFTRSFVVAAGKNQGVTKGMLVFSPQGLFARVVEVMPDHARVMTLKDYMSRVPVWVGKNKVLALLIGDNTARPYLQFLSENEGVEIGDTVMTSGYVGVYPSGLMLGVVDEIREEEVRVRLFENGEKLFFVRLVDFALTMPLLKDEE